MRAFGSETLVEDHWSTPSQFTLALEMIKIPPNGRDFSLKNVFGWQDNLTYKVLMVCAKNRVIKHGGKPTILFVGLVVLWNGS